MSDIPSFKPEWNLDDPDIIGNNADLFKTINETIARIKLIKEIGLANLYEKGVLMKNPYSTVYDMVSAIKNIPISSGYPRQIPKMNSIIKINSLNTSNSAWITTIPIILTTFRNIKINSIKTLKEYQSNPYFVNWKQFSSKEEGSFSIQTKKGDSVFCFVWYSILSDEEENTLPFELSDNWTLVKISESLVKDNLSYRFAYWVKDNKATGENEEIFINNTGEREINCALIDFWNYTSIFEYIMEYSGKGEQKLLKEYDNNYLWVFKSFGNTDSSFVIKPDSVTKNRIFNEKNKQNLLYLDRDLKGERIFSSESEEIYSFSALKF